MIFKYVYSHLQYFIVQQSKNINLQSVDKNRRPGCLELKFYIES